MNNNNIQMEPLTIPPDFTNPGKKYKQQIVLASLAIIAFIFMYFGLAFWFLYKAYRLFADLFSGGTDGILRFMVALLITFLGIFMLKAIFFLYRKNKTEGNEIKKEDEPQLFEFIYKIADEAKETPDVLRAAPTRCKVRRLDETAAARKPCLAG